MYVCIRAHWYVCMFVYVCVYVHIYVCMYTCTLVCMYVCICVCICTYVSMYMRLNAATSSILPLVSPLSFCTCMYVYMITCIYALRHNHEQLLALYSCMQYSYTSMYIHTKEHIKEHTKQRTPLCKGTHASTGARDKARAGSITAADPIRIGASLCSTYTPISRTSLLEHTKKSRSWRH